MALSRATLKERALHPLQCDVESIHEEVILRVRAVMPDQDEFQDLANLYKMLSSPTRVKILWALHQNEMCVCDLAVLLNMTKSAISHQLKSLRLSNLVKFQRQGKNIYYSLADDHVKDIFEKGFAHVHECCPN
ncbi:MAG: metalloregulator ArsR/SmtB family transcription factor [Symbiobacteriaceae bacterium]|nr:metalloregulator ArsR/SmtB family transcription factor [Symbiobacteriaceae bacterium]